MILGNKLPSDVQQKMVEGLTRPGRFRTVHGLAIEAIQSPIYTPDGYWRGPIWAPSSMLIADGLDAMGQKQIADDLRRDFCEMAQKSGMSENYDAQSGCGFARPSIHVDFERLPSICAQALGTRSIEQTLLKANI